MAEIDLNKLIDTNFNTIVNNLPPRVMRMMMENKGLLGDEGAIYVGTGDQNKIVIETSSSGSSSSDSYEFSIPKTKAINVFGDLFTKPNGTYALRATVNNGEPSFYWVDPNNEV